MASITTNGVILEVPYVIIRSIRTARPWTLSIIGRDPRPNAHNQQQLRTFPATPTDGQRDLYAYQGDTVTFTLQAPCNDIAAVAYDIYLVDFTTGVESKLVEIAFDQIWQTNIRVIMMAIHPVTGALTYAIRRF